MEEFLHSCCKKRECVSWHGNQERHEDLEVETKWIERWCNISCDWERHEHGEELSEVPRWLKHGFQQPTNVPVFISLTPSRDRRGSSYNGSSKALYRYLLEQVRYNTFLKQGIPTIGMLKPRYEYQNNFQLYSQNITKVRDRHESLGTHPDTDGT